MAGISAYLLQIDSRIARPRRFEHVMTALNALTHKVPLTHAHEVPKASAFLSDLQLLNFIRRLDAVLVS